MSNVPEMNSIPAIPDIAVTNPILKVEPFFNNLSGENNVESGQQIPAQVAPVVDVPLQGPPQFFGGAAPINAIPLLNQQVVNNFPQLYNPRVCMLNSILAQINMVREFDAQASRYQALNDASFVLIGDHLKLLNENGDLKAAVWNLEAEANASQYDVETMEETTHFMSKRMDLQDETIKNLECQLAAQKAKENQLIEENLKLNENLENSAAQNAALQEEVLALRKNDMTNELTTRELQKLMSETMGIISASRIECGYQPHDGEKKVAERKPRKTNHKEVEGEETAKAITRSRQSTSGASGPANKLKKM